MARECGQAGGQPRPSSSVPVPDDPVPVPVSVPDDPVCAPDPVPVPVLDPDFRRLKVLFFQSLKRFRFVSEYICCEEFLC